MEGEKSKRVPITTIRLTDRGRDMLNWLSDHLGIANNSVVEIAVRKLAAAQGYAPVPPLDQQANLPLSPDDEPGIYKYGL